MESGYVYEWRVNDDAGKIRVCSEGLPNRNIPFVGDDCDGELKQILDQRNIFRIRVCPPPANVLLVSFELTFEEGELAAKNISLI